MTSHQGTVIVTGVGGGIGSGWLHAHLQSSQALSHFTIYVVLPSDPGSLKNILDKEAPSGHGFEIVPLDLSSLHDIKQFITGVKTRITSGELPKIELLLLIAGNMFLDAAAADGTSFTADGGLESTFAVNYVANYALVRGFVYSAPSESAGIAGTKTMAMGEQRARIVVIGSSSHDPAIKSNSGAYPGEPFKVLLKEKGEVAGMLRGLARGKREGGLALGRVEKGDEFPAAVRRYGGSKLFLTMFMYEMNRRFQLDSALKHIRFLAYDPGIVGGTKLTDSMPWYIRMVMQYVLVPIQAVSVYFWPGGNLRTTWVAGRDLQWCCWDEGVKGGEYWDGRIKGKSSEESLEAEKWGWVVEGTKEVVGDI